MRGPSRSTRRAAKGTTMSRPAPYRREGDLDDRYRRAVRPAERRREQRPGDWRFFGDGHHGRLTSRRLHPASALPAGRPVEVCQRHHPRSLSFLFPLLALGVRNTRDDVSIMSPPAWRRPVCRLAARRRRRRVAIFNRRSPLRPHELVDHSLRVVARLGPSYVRGGARRRRRRDAGARVAPTR